MVLSSSANTRDIEECYRLGANSYITKPIAYGELEAKVQQIVGYWLSTVELPAH